MGRVSAFLGMVLYMYPEKNGRHNRPHVHVLYGDDECVLSVPEGEVLATLPIENRNIWTKVTADIKLPDGVYAFYFTYVGDASSLQMRSFELN